ncbi:MAG: hypothetical protein F6J93_04495 [Oscillatoria sp. SIO1A7]|nr:hypothetical protein [Oscillatoria sp. SIO1A7]
MPNAQFPIPHSQCPMPNSQFPIPNSPFPIPHSQFPIYNVVRYNTTLPACPDCDRKFPRMRGARIPSAQ